MDFALAVSVMKRLAVDHRQAMFLLSGGEPTLHPRFEELLNLALDLFPEMVSVNTNGVTPYFLTGKFRPVKTRQNLFYQVSLDGDEATHDRVRGAGNFRRAVDTIRQLTDTKLRVVVSTVVNEMNRGELKTLHETIADLGVKKWTVSREMPFGNASCSLGPRLSTSTWNELVDEIIGFACLPVRIRKSYDFSLLARAKDLVDLKRTHMAVNCGSGNNKIYIDVDMMVYGCTCLRDFPFGNLKEQSLSEIFLSQNSGMIRNYRLKESSPCLSCQFLEICNGGCIGMSYHQFGELGLGDAHCPVVAQHFQNRGDESQ